MLVDILGTSRDQCWSMVQYSFTPMETRRLISVMIWNWCCSFIMCSYETVFWLPSFCLVLWRWGWRVNDWNIFLLPLVYLWDCILQHGGSGGIQTHTSEETGAPVSHTLRKKVDHSAYALTPRNSIKPWSNVHTKFPNLKSWIFSFQGQQSSANWMPKLAIAQSILTQTASWSLHFGPRLVDTAGPDYHLD